MPERRAVQQLPHQPRSHSGSQQDGLVLEKPKKIGQGRPQSSVYGFAALLEQVANIEQVRWRLSLVIVKQLTVYEDLQISASCMDFG